MLYFHEVQIHFDVLAAGRLAGVLVMVVFSQAGIGRFIHNKLAFPSAEQQWEHAAADELPEQAAAAPGGGA